MSELKPTTEESIRHFETQQKRYVREHNGKLCPHYANAINALRRAQPANEPLTLEDGFDITNADGTPVDYDALGRKYKDQLCYCDIDEFYIGEDGQLVLMDDCGASVSVDRGDYCIRAHKPGGEQDA